MVNIRGRTDKLAVWLADATHQESVMRIGRMIKQRLGIDTNTTIGFNIHHEEKNKPITANINKPRIFV